MSQSTTYIEILNKYFGYTSFRGIQEDIINSIGSGRDTLGLMPTGGGKSITFQVPALAMEGVCIVITPLIALMKDQVEHLKKRGILAAYINSNLSYTQIVQTLDNAIYGGVKFLYISPERIASDIFQAKLRYMKLCFITVDEAHCISQWGYDFRPSYLKINEIRDLVPDIPVLALTATATPEVIEDIQVRLQFPEKNVYKMSFKRDNLIYVVRRTEDKLHELLHIINNVKGSAIVYTRNRQGTKDIARYLSDNGISATFYHAGLDFAVKDQRQMDWQEDRIRVIVATNAFGMGIDKPDVRLVIHLDCPDSIEAYFQEAGRGGRDGKRSYAVMLCSKRDSSSLINHVNAEFPQKEYIRLVYDHISYYLQVAIDTGEGDTYEFDIEKFCITFKHYPTHLLAALSILERAGYISFNPDPDNHPRIKFLMRRDQLYRLESLTKTEEQVIETLLRTYGNLFADLGYVELARIAMETGFTEEQIHVALKSLSHFHIIKYIPRRNVPIITFTIQRIDSSRLRFDKSIYEDMKDRALKRVNAINEYIESNTECRSKMLLSYFGEDSKECGKCDVCLNNNNSVSPKRETLDLIKNQIRDLINSKDNVFVSELKTLPYPKKELEQAISEMHADNEFTLDGSMVRL